MLKVLGYVGRALLVAIVAQAGIELFNADSDFAFLLSFPLLALAIWAMWRLFMDVSVDVLERFTS